MSSYGDARHRRWPPGDSGHQSLSWEDLAVTSDRESELESASLSPADLRLVRSLRDPEDQEPVSLRSFWGPGAVSGSFANVLMLLTTRNP